MTEPIPSAPRRRKRIRLPLERYADEGSICHITLVNAHRQPVLDNGPLALELVQSLRIACSNGGANLLLFCVMGNHLHAVDQVLDADLISIIRNYKSFSTRIWWTHGGTGALWQRSAYDRGVRGEAYLDQVLRYVFENPISEERIG
jgi:REP element-mobilizing transposase RayT